MTSIILCNLQPNLSLKTIILSSSSSSTNGPSLIISSRFLGGGRNLKWCKTAARKLGPNSGSKTSCWFRFGKNGVDAEGAGIYGSQGRNDYDRDDVEQYFNYMGMLAVDGTYDKMEALLQQNIHPVDILLMLAASEADKPKIEELMRAGANYNVKDVHGQTALDRAVSAGDDIKDFILGCTVQKV